MLFSKLGSANSGVTSLAYPGNTEGDGGDRLCLGPNLARPAENLKLPKQARLLGDGHSRFGVEPCDGRLFGTLLVGKPGPLQPPNTRVAGSFVLANGPQNMLSWRSLARLKLNALRTQRALPPSRCLAYVTDEAGQGAENTLAPSRGSVARVVSGKASFLQACSLVVVTALSGPGAKPARGIFALLADLRATPPIIGTAFTNTRCKREL